jgi:hypothetical protein
MDNLLKEIREAYSNTKLKPARNCFYKRNNCACPLGALALYNKVFDVTDGISIIELKIRTYITDRFSADFFYGIIDGNDGIENDFILSTNEKYREAHKLGAKLWEELNATNN